MSLDNFIKSQISINGPIRLDDFINYCLYDKKYGYYQKNTIFGTSGDFITAPEISQCFGEMVALYFNYLASGIWSQNKYFDIIELGAGRGILMSDFLRIADHDKIGSVNIVEISDNLKNIQKQNLHKYLTKESFDFSWHNELIEVSFKNKLFIIANEFFDAFPIRQFIKKDGKFFERLINYSDDLGFHFVFANQPLDIDNPIFSHFDKNALIHIANDQIIEISELANNYIKNICTLIKQYGGIAVLIDYGYIKNDFVDTLQALKEHKYHNIFSEIGNADITHLINFDLYKKIIEKENISNINIITQREFLLSLGIEERVANLIKNLTCQKTKETLSDGLSKLVSPDKMGELFKVLLLWQ